jgi:LmbE family N-acetylglucosaminyl deacetylase
MHPEHRSIGELAYHLWQARGCPDGSAERDWLDAERQLQLQSEKSAAEKPALPSMTSDAPWKAASAPRAGSTARPRRPKSTEGKPSPEPPG